jgi:hypothetical protein
MHYGASVHRSEHYGETWRWPRRTALGELAPIKGSQVQQCLSPCQQPLPHFGSLAAFFHRLTKHYEGMQSLVDQSNTPRTVDVA